MLRLILLLGSMAVVASVRDRGARGDGKKITWAQVMSAPPHSPLTPQTYNQWDDSTSDNDDSNNDRHGEEYDESFFENHDYEYVDTEDVNFRLPPQPADSNTKTAQRRTFGYIFNALMDRYGNQSTNDKGPSRGTTADQPSLFEDLVRTIDKHIIRNLQDWSEYFNQGNSRPTQTRPTTVQGLPIQPAQDDDLVLIRDETGQQHVITINDIVTSLSHLDEQTLTDLLLSPEQPSESNIIARMIPNPASASTNNDPSLLPSLQQTPSTPAPSSSIPSPPLASSPYTASEKSDTKEVQRPVRQTDLEQASSGAEEDVYIVQDENGAIQVVTFEDILRSLSQMDSSSVDDLLFGEDKVSEEVLLSSQSNMKSKPPQGVPLNSWPIIGTEDENGQVHVHEPFNYVTPTPRQRLKGDAEEEEERVKTASSEEGHGVRTDAEGNLHINPMPGQPITLHEIISLAEQAGDRPVHQHTIRSHRLQNSKSTLKNKHEQEDGEKENPTGEEILRYLEDGPRKEELNNQAQLFSVLPEVTDAVHHQHIPQLLAMSIPKPPSPPTPPRPPPPPRSPGIGNIGSTISDLLSRITGYDLGQQQRPSVQTPGQTNTNEEYVQLVVREQHQDSEKDQHLGQIVIPLPKPIHFEVRQEFSTPPTTTQQPSNYGVQTFINTLTGNNGNGGISGLIRTLTGSGSTSSSRTSSGSNSSRSQSRNNNGLPSVLHHLSPAVQETLWQQANSEPKFNFQRQSQVERMDQESVEFISTEEGGGELRSNPVSPNARPISVPSPHSSFVSSSSELVLSSVAPVSSSFASALPIMDTQSPQVQHKPSITVTVSPLVTSILSRASLTSQDTPSNKASSVSTDVPAMSPHTAPKPAYTRKNAQAAQNDHSREVHKTRSAVSHPSTSLPRLPASLLKKLPPKVLESLRKQYITSHLNQLPDTSTDPKAQDRIQLPVLYEYVEVAPHFGAPYQFGPPPIHSSHEFLPQVHETHEYVTVDEYGNHHPHGDYGHDSVEYNEPKHPLFDVFLLADVTKVHKIGESNLSVKAPKIGDSSYFVDTWSRHNAHRKHHKHHHQPEYHPAPDYHHPTEYHTVEYHHVPEYQEPNYYQVDYGLHPH